MAVIAIDFDGTCVTHEYPKVGKDIGAVPVIKKLVKYGHSIVLFTMRHDDGLKVTVQWFADNDIPLYGVNVNPTQHEWTNSPKAYANVYIDDAALGCPLVYPDEGRPYVDWTRVELALYERGMF